ncbi:uncharacterized protein LOC135476308 [Liolophura sinensis]|uniref:uncharacterized protein LOC135476308 n=1 Tax=Liolophura sinensis TaxID=3198878 RepID=UPI0031597A23
MATLGDHIYLGCILIASAIWWTIQASKRYNFSRQRQQEFFTSVTFPCCAALQKYPVEAVVKIIAGFLGILSQLRVGDEHSRRAHMDSLNLGKARFLPVYLAIVISGVTDALVKWYPRQILSKLNWILLAMVYVLLMLLFWNPAGSLDDVLFVLGQLEGFLAGFCCFVVIMEARFSRSIGFCLLRGYFTLVMGSWMCHIGLLSSDDTQNQYPTSDTNIFSTPLNELEGHTRIILVTLYFTWHCGIGMLLQLIIWIITMRLAQENQCLCPVQEAKTTDGVCLENRVYLEEIDILGH